MNCKGLRGQALQACLKAAQLHDQIDRKTPKLRLTASKVKQAYRVLTSGKHGQPELTRKRLEVCRHCPGNHLIVVKPNIWRCNACGCLKWKKSRLQEKAQYVSIEGCPEGYWVHLKPEPKGPDG